MISPTTPPLPARIVVGLDGSGQGRRALQVGREVAAAVDAEVTLLSVVEDKAEYISRAEYLCRLQERPGEHLALVLEPDVRGALARRAEGELLCLATRGRGAMLRSLLGSVAFAELACAAQPALLVGDECRSFRAEGRVVLPVTDTVDFRESLGLAASWAAGLDTTVAVVTVSGSGPAAEGGEELAHGAVARLMALGVAATSGVVSPGGEPMASLSRWLHREKPALVVAPSTITSGQARALLHSHIADLVSIVPSPLLVVPSRSRLSDFEAAAAGQS